MSASYLLDANALITLVVSDHEHHETAMRWASRVDQLALCPIVEGALVRFLVRVSGSHSTATAVLSGLYASPRCTFWSDSLSYAATDLRPVVGYRQVTDAYLAALAASRGCRLATFDRALTEVLPDETELIQ